MNEWRSHPNKGMLLKNAAIILVFSIWVRAPPPQEWKAKRLLSLGQSLYRLLSPWEGGVCMMQPSNVSVQQVKKLHGPTSLFLEPLNLSIQQEKKLYRPTCLHLEPTHMHLEPSNVFIQQEKKLYGPTYLHLEHTYLHLKPTYLHLEPSNVVVEQVKPLNWSEPFWSLLLMS